MQKKSKRSLFNILMAVGIAVIAAVIFLGVRALTQADPLTAAAICSSVSGNARIERNGVTYSLKKDSALVSEDKITTLKSTEADFVFGKLQNISVGASGSFKVNSDNEMSFSEGEAVVWGKSISLKAVNYAVESDDAVLWLSAKNSVVAVYVMSGKLSLSQGDKVAAELDAGQCLTVTADGQFIEGDFDSKALSDFAVKKVLASGYELIFTEAELNSVEQSRSDFMSEAGSSVSAESSLSSQESSLDSEESVAAGADSEIYTSDDNEESYREEADSETSQPEQSEPDTQESSAERTMTVTIAIDCSSVLNNMDKLTDGKSSSVPSDGAILYPTEVEINDGDTAYDVLRRVCDAYSIQLEAAWTPAFGSYYIEGINNLYEFDCGSASGWVYRVNGWSPNYGLSAYVLSDGDYVTLNYTCDYGNDV